MIFLISNCLLPNLKKSYINHSLLSTSFDHKPTFISFKPIKKKVHRKLQINHHILADPDLPIVVALTVAETYAHHISPEHLELAYNNREPLTIIGRMWQLLRNAGPHPSVLPSEAKTDALIKNRNNNLTQINNLIRDLNFNDIQNAQLTCDNVIFMETLLNNVRNEVTSYQYFINQTRSRLKTKLINEYKYLTEAPDNVTDRLHEVETKLNQLIETEISDELRKYNIFDV